jgi:hypothetical protein
VLILVDHDARGGQRTQIGLAEPAVRAAAVDRLTSVGEHDRLHALDQAPREHIHDLPLKDQPGLVVRKSGPPGLPHGTAATARVEPQHLLLEFHVDRVVRYPDP